MFDFLHSDIVRKGLAATILLEKKGVKKVNLKGIKLSYKDTFTQMPLKEFNIYYKNIIKFYNKLILTTDALYQKKYNSILKRNHFRQRIKMKMHIFKELLKLKPIKKILIIRNVFNCYVRFFLK